MTSVNISETWCIHNAQLVPAKLKTIECSAYRACKSVFWKHMVITDVNGLVKKIM